ncbi:hypothetical protein O181_024304, partial [Austropuccinia psidii MF-1]|nr:hypothetical protein [Austropuccinia psidii MF-1]
MTNNTIHTAATRNQTSITTPPNDIIDQINDNTLQSQHPDRSNISFYQLNCHNRYDTMMSMLNTELTHTALLIQEPWTNPFDWQPPLHLNWHRILPNDKPKVKEDRARTCIYVNKSIPLHNILTFPTNNPLLTWISILHLTALAPKLTLASIYNPPTGFTGLPPLQNWLHTESSRSHPTFLMIDSNLHHNLWNPTSYNHQHMEAKDLIRMCGRKGFKLISPRQVPTFLGATGRPTTIDLTWANHKAGKLQLTTSVQLENHSSDHQPILTTVTFPEHNLSPNPKHLAIHWKKIDRQTFHKSLSPKLRVLTSFTQTNRQHQIDEQVEGLTKALRDALEEQARRDMLRTQTDETKKIYYQCQQLFKKKIWELKTSHWRTFLAERGPENMYQAYKFTKSRMTGEIAPLKRSDGSLTTEVEEKAALLFRGTSVTEGGTDLLGTVIPLAQEYSDAFPPVPPEEILRAINSLPNNKAAGSDTIPNEILKLAAPLLLPVLTSLFNACLVEGHYPSPWKISLTAIIRKNDKDDYSDPSAYRPIALLNTLGKLFEKVINNRLTFWSTTEEILHPGHMGGKPGRNINDALTVLTSWIYGKWREDKVVIGTFLDVKSAYPSVRKRKLIDILLKKSCPPYLRHIISSFLTDRSTRVRLNDYVSQPFNTPNGLPQGSPLSVTLYLLYNTDLLLPTPLTLESEAISLAYVDDVVHLVAAKSQREGFQRARQAMVQSWCWGQHHGAIFDKKKTNIVLFTKKKIQHNTIQIDDQHFPLQKE